MAESSHDSASSETSHISTTDSHATSTTDSHGSVATDSHVTTPTDSHEAAATDSHGAAAAATDSHGAAAADSHGEAVDENDPLYQIQKHAEYEFAAISILFSVDEHDDVPEQTKDDLEKFFHDLYLEKTNPTVESIYFGKLMASIDMSERWVYKGSAT